MKRLCVFYRLAYLWQKKPVKWIVCKECQRKIQRGGWQDSGVLDMTLWCDDPVGQGCEWSGDQDELIAGGCPTCGGTDFSEEGGFEDADEVEPEDAHDGYDVGGEG